MRHVFSVFFVTFFFLLSTALPAPEGRARRLHVHKKHNGTRRHHRQIPHYPERNEMSPAYCGRHEHHVICGPERHCDKSCDNMYSLPNCVHTVNAKCFFPRCLCNEGFVRGPAGHCIRPTRCPNRYVEPEVSEEDDLFVDFKPIRFPKKFKVRKVRHRRPHEIV